MRRSSGVLLSASLGGCHAEVGHASTATSDSSSGLVGESTATTGTAETTTSAVDHSTSTSTATTTTGLGSSDASDGSTTMTANDCGNRVVDAGEECDDGNFDDGDACSAHCLRTFEIVWTATHASAAPAPAFDDAEALAIDDEDAVWVVGSESPEADDENLWLRQYASDGTEGSTFSWAGADGLDDRGQAIAWSNGLLFIGGVTTSIATHEDIVLMAVDPVTRGAAWSHVIDGPGGLGRVLDDSDYASAVGIDPHGNAVFGGHLGVGAEQGNLWIAEYSAEGVLQWEQDWDQGSGLDDSLQAMRVADDGRVHALVGSDTPDGYQTRLLVFDDDGNPLPDEALELPLEDRLVTDFQLLANGDVLAAAVDASGIVAARLDSEWMDAWSTHASGSTGGDFAFAVAAQADEGAVVAGMSGSGDPIDAWAGGFRPDGAPWWGDVYDGGAQDHTIWVAVAIDSQGDVIVAGRGSAGDQGFDAVVRKYHPLCPGC